ncbi:hypothetical protein TSMEX_001980 [Taenia solium]|eukprot:TsM_000898000 transcript=TsM_000898000 gene=TsM_000898000
MKTNDLNQLVEAATRKCQKLLLTSALQTVHLRPNSPRPRWTPSCQTPRAGEAYYSLSCQPPNASCPFLQALGKLKGYPCRFLLDSGAVRPLVNPKAFPDLLCKVRADPSSIKLLAAEGRKMNAIGETSLKITVRKET